MAKLNMAYLSSLKNCCCPYCQCLSSLFCHCLSSVCPHCLSSLSLFVIIAKPLHGNTEHDIRTEYGNCGCPHCRCHHLGYSLPPAQHRTIWYRSTFGPRGPGLSNPTSFLRPALPMAPTTDNNARNERSVKRFHALYDDNLRYFKKNVSKLY